MMQRLTLFFIAVLIGGCAPDGPLFETNPVSPSAKLTASRDPFFGQDEEGHVDAIGASAETFRTFFQVVTRRMALALQDKEARAVAVRYINDAPQQEANIVKLLSANSGLLKTVTEGFVKEINEANIPNSKLADLIFHMADDAAFLAVSEAFFGLEIQLVNEGQYQAAVAVPIFHDPIIDEKDTERWEGFAPDGEAETMPFSMDGFTRSDAFFYITYDDEFYKKSANAITAQVVPLRPRTFFAKLSPLALLVKPAWAHHPNNEAHGALPDCFHDEWLMKSAYLTRFKFTDDHEAVGSPEMVIHIRASHRTMPRQWNNHKIPDGEYEFEEADEENTWYPDEDELYPELWHHPGYNCHEQVFDASDSKYGQEDWVNVWVIEEDLGHWLNPDDKVGHWKFVPTYGTGNNPTYLTPTHSKCHGDVHDAYVYLLFHQAGASLRNE